MKQGQIKYLENQNLGNNPLGHNNNKQRAKLEDPNKFTSKKDDKGNYLIDKGQAIDFDTQKSNIETKLKVDNISFDNKAYKIFYIGSRTARAVYKHIQDRLNNKDFETARQVL